MATRKKHLINVHTSTGTTAPTAADLRLGEIAVQHTSENPALWIKMGNTESSAVYEKFIGSTEITNMLEDSKILGSGYTYSGIPYVNSSTTLADAYSALTREMIDDEKVVAAALNDLNGRVIEISGNTPDMTNYYDKGEVEHIISVSGGTDVSPLSGAVMSLSAGTIALVGSSAASVFSSAKTYTDSEIGKLDSTGHTSDSGHYLTSVTITDGIITAVGEKPVPGETDITTATSGNGNVISNLTVTGHQITMVKGVTAATSAQVSTLSAATHAHIANGNIHVTGAQKTAWTNGANSGASAYTGVTQLSGAVGSLEDEVAKIAVTAVTVSGTGNAVVAATYSDSALTLGKGNVQAVISDLATIRSNAASGMQAYNDVRSLSAATTGISQTLNTVSGAAHNKITALSAATTGMGQGLSNLSAATLSAVTAKGDNYIDASVASRSAITVTTKKPVVTDLSAAISGTGSLADAKAIKTYIDNTLSSTVTYKGATASLPSNPAAGDMWVAASAFTAGRQSVEVGDFVIARTSGTSAQWDVIEKNLDGAITGALTADTVTLGESTNSVKSLANGSNGTVLAISGNKPVWTSAVKVSSASVADNALKVNNHTVSTDVPAGAVFTDTATTEGGHYTPSKSASTEGSATGFIQQIKLDSKKHVVGIVSGSVSDTATTETGHYTPSTSASTKGTTAATTTSFIKGIRVDSKSHVIDVVTGTVVTAQTQLSYNSGSSVSNNASAVMTGLTVSNHAITYGKTNKIFSASTSDSATTANSATTAGSAVSATTSQSAGTAAALTGNITTGQVTDLAATIKNTTVNSATTATSAKTSSSAVTTTSAVTSQSAATAAALTGNITTGQVTNLTTKIQTTKVNSATTADSAANATHAAAATKVDSALTINILDTTGGTASTVTFNGSANKTVNVPANTDTATTETGHYTPGTSASTEGSATGFIRQIRLDSKKHVVGIVSGTTSYTETAVTTKNGTTGSTAAPVLSSITTGGTKGHQLTLNYTNKVNSATTANSAVTATNAVSATTSLSAKSADNSAKLGGVAAANYSLTSHTHDEYATTATLNALSAATDTHVGDGDIHVTAQQKGGWDAKQDAITDLAQIRNNALSGASAYTRVQELSASVIANRDAISALTDSLEELSGAVWSKEFVIAMGMNDLRDKIREISGSTGLPDVTAADDGKILRVQSGAWAMVDPTVIYTGSGTPASTLGNEGDIYFQL